MEYLTVELDCTDDRCGKCKYLDKDYEFSSGCLLFMINIEREKDTFIRSEKCIQACKKHKDKVGKGYDYL